MRAIFISYRRDDSQGQARLLHKDLARHFGKKSVFIDVDGIRRGVDFREEIAKKLSQCGAFLCVIGRRRLDSPSDSVRLEIAAALKNRKISVIPVLVARAQMPNESQLPDDLKALAYRNAVEITHARWDTDVRDLIKTLPRPSTIFRRMIIGIILVAVSTLALKQCSPLDGPPQPSERQNSHRAHH
jgi:TIR domain-containing protein